MPSHIDVIWMGVRNLTKYNMLLIITHIWYKSCGYIQDISCACCILCCKVLRRIPELWEMIWARDSTVEKQTCQCSLVGKLWVLHGISCYSERKFAVSLFHVWFMCYQCLKFSPWFCCSYQKVPKSKHVRPVHSLSLKVARNFETQLPCWVCYGCFLWITTMKSNFVSTFTLRCPFFPPLHFIQLFQTWCMCVNM